MSNSKIGLKEANGSFYEILDEESHRKKKLVLTTVKDNQTSVQIDLYKSEDGEIDDSLYIGSLVIENIKPALKKEPEINLIVGIDDNGNLNASATDSKTGEHQSLSVSLETLEKEDIYDIPEFELDPAGEEDDSEATIINTAIDTSFEEEASSSGNGFVKKKHPLRLVGFILLVLALLAGLVLFLIHLDVLPDPRPEAMLNSDIKTADNKNGNSETDTGNAIEKPEEETEVSSSNSVESSEEDTESVDMDTAGSESRDADSEKALYQIKWGDTLWGIAASYYKNPWMYKKIAKENEIHNPDRIIAGSKIYISKE